MTLPFHFHPEKAHTMKTPKVPRSRTHALLVAASLAALSLLVGAGCGGDDTSVSASAENGTDAAASSVKDASGGRDRFAQDPDAGSQCVNCSMIAGILVDGTGFGGGGPGGSGGPPGGGDGGAIDPCADSGAGGGAGGPGGGAITFCKPAVSNAFTQCLQDKCSVPCNFNGTPGGGGGQCVRDAAAAAADVAVVDPTDAAPDGPLEGGRSDPDAGDGGGDCKACVVTHCAAPYVACEADK